MLIKISQKDFFDVLEFHPYIKKEFIDEYEWVRRKDKYRKVDKLDIVLKKSEELKGNTLVCCFKRNADVLIIDRKSRSLKLRFVKDLIEKSIYFDKR